MDSSINAEKPQKDSLPIHDSQIHVSDAQKLNLSTNGIADVHHNPPQLERAIEAVIFSAESPVTPTEILDAFARQDVWIEFQSLEKEVIIEALHNLMARYHSKDYAFELRAVGGGYQFYSKTEFAPFVRSLLVIRENKKLSRAALETLSIVAYRQPITKAEIEYIRGVNCDYAMQKLLEKQLVEPAGRADLPGKPLLYRTTHFFFEYFGINSIEDLPKLKEFKTDEENLPAAS